MTDPENDTEIELSEELAGAAPKKSAPVRSSSPAYEQPETGPLSDYTGPNYERVQDIQSPAQRGKSIRDIPEVDQPTPSDQTDWEEYTAYKCRHCKDDCINRIVSVYARARECRACFALPTIDGPFDDDPAIVGRERESGSRR